MKEEFNAWAIQEKLKNSDAWLKRYYFPQSKCMEGHKIALFKTRKIAREYCNNMNNNSINIKAKVVKVKVSIETVE